MSIASLSARLFRFLAVAASASFIVLIVGTGSHADQPTSLVSTPAITTPAAATSPLPITTPTTAASCRFTRPSNTSCTKLHNSHNNFILAQNYQQCRQFCFRTYSNVERNACLEECRGYPPL